MTIEQRLKRLEKQAGITEQPEWPPAGVAIEMWCDGDDASNAVSRVSSGGGKYYVMGHNGEELITFYGNWRYHVPPWPEWAQTWIVVSNGSCFFSQFPVWDAGDRVFSGDVVAVIKREDRE